MMQHGFAELLVPGAPVHDLVLGSSVCFCASAAASQQEAAGNSSDPCGSNYSSCYSVCELDLCAPDHLNIKSLTATVVCLVAPAGISLVDAGSMAVFSVACMVLYKYAKRFVKDVDDSTMEVADYTGWWRLRLSSQQQSSSKAAMSRHSGVTSSSMDA
jgi:hypothetical protein